MLGPQMTIFWGIEPTSTVSDSETFTLSWYLQGSRRHYKPFSHQTWSFALIPFALLSAFSPSLSGTKGKVTSPGVGHYNVIATWANRSNPNVHEINDFHILLQIAWLFRCEIAGFYNQNLNFWHQRLEGRTSPPLALPWLNVQFQVSNH